MTSKANRKRQRRLTALTLMKRQAPLFRANLHVLGYDRLYQLEITIFNTECNLGISPSFTKVTP